MSLKKINILVIICLFPVFTLRSNLAFSEIILVSSIFLISFIFLNYIIIKKNIIPILSKLYVSLIVTIGIDANLGLWNGLIQPFRFKLIDYFKIIYYPGILLFSVIFAISFFIISRTSEKFHNVIGIFLLTIFSFNIIDQTKSHTKIKDYLNSTNQNFQKTELVIIFDEMSGLNSFESDTSEGKKFDDIAKALFNKYNFEYFSNARSNSANSVSSIASLLNFSEKEDLRSKVSKVSQNYFYEYELNKNLFFEKYKNISVYQNIHIDYCLFENVTKCKTHNPFKQDIYLDGFKDTFLTKIISIWKLNGSIISTLTWRSLRELRIIDSNLEPEGHKTAFNDFFNNLEKDIYSKKYDLIFAHPLVPHKPYGFKKNCEYDGNLSLRNTFYSIKEHRDQHNVERICVFLFLDAFLENLKNNDFLDQINLTILSDHGARIKRIDESYLSVIYAYRDKDTKFREFKGKTLSQNIFSNRYN